MDRFAADNGYWDFDFVGKEIFKRAVEPGAAAHAVMKAVLASPLGQHRCCDSTSKHPNPFKLCGLAGIETIRRL